MSDAIGEATRRLTRAVRDSLQRTATLGGSILVAVSGGADSVALLRALVGLSDECGLRLVVAHLDHRLRAESRDDADWVGRLPQQWELPFAGGFRDVRAFMETSGTGLEEAARHLRYEFLREAAVEHDCRFVAVGHTADDQAETVLHQLIRGTGLAGLRGMPEARVLQPGTMLIRPLLTVSRETVRRYLAELGQDFRTDETNEDLHQTRNRIRKTLLPLLQSEFNPQIATALCRLAQQAGEVQEIIATEAAGLLDRVLLDVQPDIARLDVAGIAGIPRHFVRECLRLLWDRQRWPRGRMGFEEWDALAALAFGPSGAELEGLPQNVTASRRGGMLVIRRERMKDPASVEDAG